MVTNFTASTIDLSRLPAPNVVKIPDFEIIVAEMKADYLDRHDGDPEIAALLELESDPVVKQIEVFAYRELVKRAEYNDDCRAVMLAFAVGSDLDHLAANRDVTRLIVQVEDLVANPAVPQILESDSSLRKRTQMAPEGDTTAGSSGSYIFHGLSADGRVKDIGVTSPAPAYINVAVLSHVDDGTPDATLLSSVEVALNGEDIRPLCDRVTVQPANISIYQIDATLTLYEGPDADLVHAGALATTQDHVDQHHAIGHDITISGLHAALHQVGVQKVNLASPAADLVIDAESAAYCSQISITIGGRDE